MTHGEPSAPPQPPEPPPPLCTPAAGSHKRRAHSPAHSPPPATRRRPPPAPSSASADAATCQPRTRVAAAGAVELVARCFRTCQTWVGMTCAAAVDPHDRRPPLAHSSPLSKRQCRHTEQLMDQRALGTADIPPRASHPTTAALTHAAASPPAAAPPCNSAPRAAPASAASSEAAADPPPSAVCIHAASTDAELIAVESVDAPADAASGDAPMSATPVIAPAAVVLSSTAPSAAPTTEGPDAAPATVAGSIEAAEAALRDAPRDPPPIAPAGVVPGAEPATATRDTAPAVTAPSGSDDSAGHDAFPHVSQAPPQLAWLPASVAPLDDEVAASMQAALVPLPPLVAAVACCAAPMAERDDAPASGPSNARVTRRTVTSSPCGTQRVDPTSTAWHAQAAINILARGAGASFSWRDGQSARQPRMPRHGPGMQPGPRLPSADPSAWPTCQAASAPRGSASTAQPQPRACDAAPAHVEPLVAPRDPRLRPRALTNRPGSASDVSPRSPPVTEPTQAPPSAPSPPASSEPRGVPQDPRLQRRAPASPAPSAARPAFNARPADAVPSQPPFMAPPASAPRAAPPPPAQTPTAAQPMPGRAGPGAGTSVGQRQGRASPAPSARGRGRPLSTQAARSRAGNARGASR
jgi:hypothetical protein